MVRGRVSAAVPWGVGSSLRRGVPPSFVVVRVPPAVLEMASSRVPPIALRPETLLGDARRAGAPLPVEVGVKVGVDVSAIGKLFPPQPPPHAVIMLHDERRRAPGAASELVPGGVHRVTRFPKVLLIPVPVAA